MCFVTLPSSASFIWHYQILVCEIDFEIEVYDIISKMLVYILPEQITRKLSRRSRKCLWTYLNFKNVLAKVRKNVFFLNLNVNFKYSRLF